MRVGNRARWALVIVAAAALVFVAAAAARTHTAAKKGPIVIGWAHDSTGSMAPFDGPALAAAQLRLKTTSPFCIPTSSRLSSFPQHSAIPMHCASATKPMSSAILSA